MFSEAGMVDFTTSLGTVSAWVVGSDGNDTIIGGSSGDNLIGADGQDVLYGGDGGDFLQTYWQAMPTIFGDTLYGGAGNDTFRTSNEDFFAGTLIYGGEGYDVLNLAVGLKRSHDLHELILTPEMGIEAVTGRIHVNPNRINTIDLGTARFDGHVYLGGEGTYFRADFGYYGVIAGLNDTIFASDQPNELVGGGLVHAGAGDDTLRGGVTFHGDDGNDWMVNCAAAYGGSGNDVIESSVAAYGGDGDDLVIGNWGALVFGGKGKDAFFLNGTLSLDGSAVNYSTGDDLGDFETVRIGHAILSDLGDQMDISAQREGRLYFPVWLEGRGGDDLLVSGEGKQTLDGGLGADTMDGGAGNDVYIIDNAGDVVIEAVGGGIDRVIISADFVLSDVEPEIERYELDPDAEGITVTGNDGRNAFYGGDPEGYPGGAEGVTFLGLGGKDRIVGYWSSSVYGGKGDDRLQVVSGQIFGGDGDDLLTAGRGGCTLYGGKGADTFFGGAGDDAFYIEEGDVIESDLGPFGRDEVRSHLAYFDMTENWAPVADFKSLSDDGVMVVGNSWGNRIVGGDGNDSLDGGAGADVLVGGLGDDTYWVQDARDEVREAAGEGQDTILSLAAVYVLAESVEAGVGLVHASKLTGNALDNTLSGLSTRFFGMEGNDTITAGDQSVTLDGGLGDDLMTGGLGANVFVVDSLGDVVIETAVVSGPLYRSDEVQTTLASYVLPENVEYLVGTATTGQALTGNAEDNWLIGGSGNDSLAGAGGDDVLQGWRGVDRLTGGTGEDAFLFDGASLSGEVDQVLDFVHLTDVIVLVRDDRSGAFTGLTPGALTAAAFTTSSVIQADDRIIYRNSTGALYFDPDGSGAAAAVQFAVLTTRPSLSIADFLVI